MSAGAGGGGDSDSLEFDLNLAPIIDCFTVLITFMLVSASFISISVIDASVAPLQVITETTDPTQVSPPVTGIKAKLKLMTQGDCEFSISGEVTSSERLPLNQVASKIEGLKKQWKEFNSLELLAEESVKYSDLVSVVEQLRKSIPSVQFGGF